MNTSPPREEQVFNKVAWRLMPVLILSYVLNYLDRNNIAFAALTMNEDVGLSATQFGIGAGILFVGYCFFEIPSNLLLYRIGARIWLTVIMVTWGLVSAANIFVTGPNSFYALRLLLGAAEAGFFPGVAYYLATWFPAEYRTRTIAWFMAAVPISSVVAGPLSGLLLEMDGVAGLAGWQWLFILEGVPVAIVGLSLLWILADRPASASWLTDDERRLIHATLEREKRANELRHFGPAIRDIRVIILAGIQFSFLVGSYGVGIWLPQMLREGNLTSIEIGLISSACYALATIAMILWAARVDKSG
jgi:sugar phosphate permease